MLSKEIQEFIFQIKKLGDVGCLIVPAQGMERLLTLLGQADVIIGADQRADRVTCYPLKPDQPMLHISAPAIIVVTEEDYTSSDEWRGAIQDIAGYYLNLAPAKKD
ncbi:MAG: hypothetical protein HQM16_10940 [Deltaproteobacteria bacterium]|nr:hypothetical protein [Deltaproteobacteria bacterium]